MAIGTGAAILGAGALAVGGSIFGASQASKASEKAARTQGNTAVATTQMQLDFLRETRADIADAVDAGLIDLDTGLNMAVMSLTGGVDLGGGFSPIQEYIRTLQSPEGAMARPAGQYFYNRGLEALRAAYSRSAGGGVSGPAMIAAMEYGQNYAANQLDQELARIGNLIPVQSNIAAMRYGTGGTKANLRVGGATGSANITGQAIPGLTATSLMQGNAAATNYINQANIASTLASSVGNQASDLALLYALRPSLFSDLTK